jgi:hypothetical protein
MSAIFARMNCSVLRRQARRSIDTNRSTKVNDWLTSRSCANNSILATMGTIQQFLWINTTVNCATSRNKIIVSWNIFPLLPRMNIGRNIVQHIDCVICPTRLRPRPIRHPTPRPAPYHFPTVLPVIWMSPVALRPAASWLPSPFALSRMSPPACRLLPLLTLEAVVSWLLLPALP